MRWPTATLGCAILTPPQPKALHQALNLNRLDAEADEPVTDAAHEDFELSSAASTAAGSPRDIAPITFEGTEPPPPPPDPLMDGDALDTIGDMQKVAATTKGGAVMKRPAAGSDDQDRSVVPKRGRPAASPHVTTSIAPYVHIKRFSASCTSQMSASHCYRIVTPMQATTDSTIEEGEKTTIEPCICLNQYALPSIRIKSSLPFSGFTLR